MMPFFEQGDVDALCDRRIAAGKKYSVVHLDNVLEYVVDPRTILEKCEKLMEQDGILYVDVPNDFNPLQAYLCAGGFIQEKKWI